MPESLSKSAVGENVVVLGDATGAGGVTKLPGVHTAFFIGGTREDLIARK